MDYNSLIGTKTTAGSIAQWTNVTDTKLDLQSILYDAQALLYNGGLAAGGQMLNPLRTRDMRKTGATVTLTVATWVAALPADFLSVINLRDPMLVPLTPLDINSLQRRRCVDTNGNPQSGTYPHAYALDQSNILFDLAPDSTLSMLLDYYALPAFLSNSVQTNFLTVKYPHLLRAACLAMAADFMNDDGKYARNVAKLSSLLQAINVTDEADSLAGVQVDRTYPDSDYGGFIL